MSRDGGDVEQMRRRKVRLARWLALVMLVALAGCYGEWRNIVAGFGVIDKAQVSEIPNGGIVVESTGRIETCNWLIIRDRRTEHRFIVVEYGYLNGIAISICPVGE